MKKKKVYVLLTDTGTMFTRMIKLCTRKPFNHASIGFDTELAEVYSFGRKTPRNPFIGGFVKENVKSGLFIGAGCAIYSCTLSECQYKKMYQKVKKLEEQKLQLKYNFLGLIAVLLKLKFHRKNAFFCSQFVATILHESGLPLVHKPLCLVTPHDLTTISIFELVYRGKLSSYLLMLEHQSCNKEYAKVN
ncbi:hypothetical protein [Bacillus sp. T33-2]|uniref:hypothetical protein n=1 Tax=Bacillus sp. T33-2 TaxID=2054168 RepID=UPI000C7847E9|nr:hypothetical protein [Bacillus sp. T33-2]PLR91967.1 hypothetical protein CVD19_21110 [Bacillus sp. T33-2]